MNNLLRISESSSLAFHAMVLLTKYRERRFSTTQMAEMFDASEHTLAKSMLALVRAGFVDSARGAGGGFALIKEPADISLLDIFEAIEGPLEPQHCLLGKPACNGKHCVMQGLMAKLHGEMHGYFSRTYLSTLADKIEIGDDGWVGDAASDSKKEGST